MSRELARASWLFAAAVALGVVVAACGGAPPADAPSPIRLTAGAGDESVTVEWPDPARRVPGRFLDTTIGSIPAPGRLARLILHREPDERDGRVALLAPAGSHYRFTLTIPRGRPVLEVGLGHSLDPLADGVEVRFHIALDDGRGGDHTLLDEVVTTQPGARWLDRRLPLDAWRGRRVTLDFATGGPARAALWPAWAVPEIVDDEASPAGYDLLLIVLDTLRADHLGAYGYERPTSPFLDRWAAAGSRFATAISQSSWTRPSHRSLFSGLYPTSRQGLASPPLAEVLWRRGYRTSALTGGAQLAYRFGFSRGFEIHRIERWVQAVDRVVEELERNRRRRHFVFLHTYEIHDPYPHHDLVAGHDPGRMGEVFERATLQRYGGDLTPAEQEYVTALYDSGIRYVDAQLESLFARLGSRGLLERTVVVVTSDHGEELWDHGGWGHGRAMFDHQTHVPLLVHLPAALRRDRGLQAAAGQVIGQQVQLVDLYPTLLELLGVALEHPIQGRSLVPLLAGGRMPRAAAFSESTYWGPLEVKSLRSERYKYMTAIPKKANSDRQGWTTLFDLESDPRETVDVSDREPALSERMGAAVEALTTGEEAAEEAVPKDLDPELEEQLRALGYLGG